MAEVGTAGRTHHINLVRLLGFCFDAGTKALVYEYLENGSRNRVLFQQRDHEHTLGFGMLYGIVVDTARGLRYLHEECLHRVVHYDVKPGNVLLAADYTPKVADFGLAKLCNRDITHLTMTGARGTPGYAAPELWLPLPVTHKCDVYSFGILVFEILGRRRNLEVQHPAESQEWYPKWVWQRFDQGRFEDVAAASGVQSEDREKAAASASGVAVASWSELTTNATRPVNPFAYPASLHAISSSSASAGDSSKESRHQFAREHGQKNLLTENWKMLSIN
jgi:serine/threonine protein kinase